MITVAAGVSLLAFGLACGGGTGGHAGNEAACGKYVEHMNGLSCMGGVTMDKSQTCAMLDMSPTNMEGYYGCLVENTSCDGQIPKISTENCSIPF